MAKKALRIGSLVLTVAAVAFWALELRPTALGGPADYVIVSGRSMLPSFRADDLAVALRQHSYAVGDVVVYHVPKGGPGAGTRVIHRIVGGSASEGFLMKGDNKKGVDPWRPTNADVVGKVRLTVPRAGAVILFLRTPFGMAGLAGLTTLLVALLALDRGRRATVGPIDVRSLPPAHTRTARTRPS
jgi:signal peptidase